MDVFLQWIPVLGALGVGSVVGNYVGAGKSRRETRSAVLAALSATEQARWITCAEQDRTPFRTAIRDLEIAALVARVPRPAVKQYAVLASAALSYSYDDYEQKDGEEELAPGQVLTELSNVVEDSAEVITRLVWRPWWSRLMVRHDLRLLRDKAADIDDDAAKRALAHAQFSRGRSTGRLGEIFDEYFGTKT